ncbi:uncharacterized protein LOC143067976 isoform X1 [Mytilus galloprovincialis]|uniref:uncharacterized protein LOC143067976 isoform X1 n=1 Tax=Mytilus galloprovincialis TaxID=29158 RepID=UPI003F7C5B53
MEEDTLDHRFRRRRSGRRSSSILKTKNPLLDIDTNQAVTEVIPRKKARISSSRRVSFAETYQVKEFQRDSPHRWLPDPESEDDSSPELERLPDVPQHTSRSEIQGLDKLLTGPIQNNLPSEEQIESELPLSHENVPFIQSGPNHTILQTDDMDMTDCFEKSKSNVEKPLVDDFGDNYGASFSINNLDAKSFLTSIGKPVLENISEKLFLPEKKFSSPDSNNMYKVEQESDFHTLINTSINKYTALSTSVTTIAGASVTFTTNVTSRKPLTSISDRSAFTPITTESFNPLDEADRPVSKVDGLSFLKQLTFKAPESPLDKYEERTIVFDGNDMEETEVLTKCIQNSEPLFSESVKVPSFLKSKMTSERSNNKMFFGQGNEMGNHTVFFGEDNNMEDTEVIRSQINFDALPNQKSKNTFLFDSVKRNENIMAKDETEKTQIFDRGLDMEQTEMLTGKLNYNECLETIGTAKATLSDNSLMEETGLITGKIDLVHSSKLLEKNKTVLYKNDDMEETNVLTSINPVGCRKSFGTDKKNKTCLFPDGNDMEQTTVFTNKIELPVLSKSNKQEDTKISDNSMEETNVLAQKIELPNRAKNIDISRGVSFDNKTLLYHESNDMEETRTVAGKIDIITKSDKEQERENRTKIFNETNYMEETCTVTSKLSELSYVKENKTTIFTENNGMEETCALTSKVEYLSCVKTTSLTTGNTILDQADGDVVNRNYKSPTVGNNTIVFNEENQMEQTRPINTTIKLDSRSQSSKSMHLSEGLKNKTVIFPDDNEMEQTQALTGKLEMGSHLSKDKTLLFKDNNEMEQTQAFTGKLEMGSHLLKDKTLLFKDNNEMEQTRALTGKLEMGSHLLKDKTSLFKDNNEMEQTQAFTGKLEMGSHLLKDKTLLFKDNNDMEQTQAMTGKLEVGLSSSPDREDKDTNQPDVIKRLSEADSDTTQNKTEQFKDGEEMVYTNTGAERLESLTENDIVKNKYHQDIEVISQNHSPGLNMLEPEVNLTSEIENYKNVGKNKKKGGISSLIDKMRKDMNGENDKNSDNTETRRESASPDITDGFFFKYKAQLESVKKNAENFNNDFNGGNLNLTDMIERMDKNACKSLGLQTRTPSGKMFVTSRDFSSEVRPPLRGSTVKISERVTQTEHKTTHEMGQHQPMHCSKELFSHNGPDFENGESPLPILEASSNITVRGRSKSDGRADNSLELPGGITDIYMPAELLTSTTISSVPPETTNYQLNLTSSSGAIIESDSSHSNLTCSSGSRSIIEINMEDYLKQSMMNDSDDGSMTVEHFCRRINVIVPFWLKERSQMARQSIATLKKVDKDSIRGQIEAKYVHEPYISVYNTVIEQAKEKLSVLKPQTKELLDTIKEEQPAVFDVGMKGSEEQKYEMKEKVTVMRKYCSKQVDKKWKDMKLHCHEQFYDVIKEKREKLSEEVNGVVQASDTIQEELSVLSNASNQLDKLILELEQKPLPEPEDIEYLNSLDQEVKQKEQEMEGLKETQVDLEREKLNLQTEKSKLQREEENINNEEEADDNIMVQLEIQELEEKLDTIESLTEWHIESYEDDFITFLFYDNTLRLSINKQREPDNGQTKIASAHVQSLLQDSASPCMKLIQAMILQQINNGDSLHQTFRYISDLPEFLFQLLQKLSMIVLNARCLKRQITSLSLNYIVTVYNDFIVVEKWSLKSLRKVNIKLTFSVEDACCNILHEVTVKMGRIRAEDVQDQMRSVSRGHNYLVKLCDSVDLDVLPDSSKFS